MRYPAEDHTTVGTFRSAIGVLVSALNTIHNDAILAHLSKRRGRGLPTVALAKVGGLCVQIHRICRNQDVFLGTGYWVPGTFFKAT